MWIILLAEGLASFWFRRINGQLKPHGMWRGTDLGRDRCLKFELTKRMTWYKAVGPRCREWEWERGKGLGWKKSKRWLGSLWYTSLNTYFQFLNNITCIFNFLYIFLPIHMFLKIKNYYLNTYTTSKPESHYAGALGRWHFEVEFYQSWSRLTCTSWLQWILFWYLIIGSILLYSEYVYGNWLHDIPASMSISIRISTVYIKIRVTLTWAHRSYYFFSLTVHSSQFSPHSQLSDWGSPANLWMIFHFLNTTKLFFFITPQKKKKKKKKKII